MNSYPLPSIGGHQPLPNLVLGVLLKSYLKLMKSLDFEIWNQENWYMETSKIPYYIPVMLNVTLCSGKETSVFPTAFINLHKDAK